MIIRCVVKMIVFLYAVGTTTFRELNTDHAQQFAWCVFKNLTVVVFVTQFYLSK
jgi:hypothetical protein